MKNELNTSFARLFLLIYDHNYQVFDFQLNPLKKHYLGI